MGAKVTREPVLSPSMVDWDRHRRLNSDGLAGLSRYVSAGGWVARDLSDVPALPLPPVPVRRGQPRSPATRQRISEAMRLRWRAKKYGAA